jgi:predicted dithiol-disulfide oxidoreductase (DUF899 family)
MNTTIAESRAAHPHVATRNAWLEERKALLEQEKELTHLRDRIAHQRRALPWVRMDEDYVFDTVEGPRRLADLFEGRSQLVVQHFMFGPGWEQGCPSCSYMADHADGMRIHLAHRDIAFTAISRAPLADIQRFRQRMGWQFPWVSSNRNDFNRDFAVSFLPEDRVGGEVDYNYGRIAFPNEEAPGVSVFCKDEAGDVFHTYSTFGRGVEVMMGTYNLVDLTPRGRDEHNPAYPMDWVRHHDRYAPLPVAKPAAAAASCCHAAA